jgi:hypothetical protein
VEQRLIQAKVDQAHRGKSEMELKNDILKLKKMLKEKDNTITTLERAQPVVIGDPNQGGKATSQTRERDQEERKDPRR